MTDKTTKPTYEELYELAQWVQKFQPEALDICRKQGFVFDFDHKSNNELDRWQKLAFTFYSSLCEIESRARQTLEE